MSELRVPAVEATEVMEGRFQVIDVRSPSEFAEGHVPGALSRPLLDDAQRAVVGTTYREKGAAKARLAALEQVAPSLCPFLLELAEVARSMSRGRRLAIMCWRGGERSRNVVLLLALIGVHAVRVTGGYRAYRALVVEGLSTWRPTMPVITLYGHTGAGKSALLRALATIGPELRRPRPWSLDLEGLALHRGSLLGGLNQPDERCQKDFEALLWDELRHPLGDYLVLEGEGGKIGQIFLPRSVGEAIRGGLPVHVAASKTARGERIVAEYAPAKWGIDDSERFRQSLRRIGRRLPKATLASLERAFEDGRFSDVVQELLTEYYDPLYQRSCVDGRDFVLQFETGPDPMRDAARFSASIARLLAGESLIQDA